MAISRILSADCSAVMIIYLARLAPGARNQAIAGRTGAV